MRMRIGAVGCMVSMDGKDFETCALASTLLSSMRLLDILVELYTPVVYVHMGETDFCTCALSLFLWRSFEAKNQEKQKENCPLLTEQFLHR